MSKPQGQTRPVMGYQNNCPPAGPAGPLINRPAARGPSLGISLQQFLDGEDLQNLTIVNNLEFGLLALARSPELADVGRPKSKREKFLLTN